MNRVWPGRTNNKATIEIHVHKISDRVGEKEAIDDGKHKIDYSFR